MASAFVDSIQLPRVDGEPEDEKIVRPSLAILFRMAVGPGADYYAPRFLEYERVGRSFPSWNWAPLLAPAVWAIYRRLWLAGLAFIAWPLLAIAAFWVALPHLADINAIGLVGTAIVVWLIPSVVGALLGNTLLYRRARRLVRTAEARTTQTDKAARWLSRRTVIAPVQAAATTAVMVVALGAMLPNLQSAYADQVVRSRIAEMMAAIQPLQRQLEEWFISRSPTDAPQIDMAEARAGRRVLRQGERQPHQRARAARAGPVDPGAVRALDPARSGDRPVATSPLDMHSGRHSCAIPAGGVQAGLTTQDSHATLAWAMSCLYRRMRFCVGLYYRLPLRESDCSRETYLID